MRASCSRWQVPKHCHVTAGVPLDRPCALKVTTGIKAVEEDRRLLLTDASRLSQGLSGPSTETKCATRALVERLARSSDESKFTVGA